MRKKWIFLIFAMILVCTSLMFYGCDEGKKLSYGETRTQIIDANLFGNWQGVKLIENIYHFEDGEKINEAKVLGDRGIFLIYLESGEIEQDVYYADGIMYNRDPVESEEIDASTTVIVEGYTKQSYFEMIKENFDSVFKNAKRYDLESGYKIVLNVSTKPLIEQGNLTEAESDSGYFTYTFVFDDGGELEQYVFESNSKKLGVQYSDAYRIELTKNDQEILPPEWFNIEDYA